MLLRRGGHAGLAVGADASSCALCPAPAISTIFQEGKGTMTEDYFHTYDGWCFRRTADGFVDLFKRFDDGKEEYLASFNPSAWASVVAFVSAQGTPPNIAHGDEPYQRALLFHSGQDQAYAETDALQATTASPREEAERRRADNNWGRADYLADLLDQHGIAYEWGVPERKASLREVDIPREIAELALELGEVEWGATAELVAAEHIADFTETLRLTREHFNYEDVPVQLHGLYLKGAETVVCHTGTSPNSPTIARTLAGLWNNFLADARTALGDG